MSLKVDSRSSDIGNGIKVEGDLGAVQIIEEHSDTDDDTSTDKHKNPETDNNLDVIPPNLLQSTSVPIFGKVAVTNSENVQFGNNTYFSGPVTIKQIIQSKSGYENGSYTRTEDQENTNKLNGSPKSMESSPKRFQFQTWHKFVLSILCVILAGIFSALIVLLQNKTTQEENNLGDSDVSRSPPSGKVVGINYETLNLSISIILIVLTLSLMLYSLLTMEDGSKSRSLILKKKVLDGNPCMFGEEGDSLLISPEHVRIVTRTEWLAQPVDQQLDKIQKPIPWVIITHTATENCYSQSGCVLRVRLIQTFHIESRGWSDIGYNFLVGGDGSAYVGRGWDYVGAHTKFYNRYSVGIAFIGTFNSDPPPKQQIDACRKLIDLGVKQGVIAKDYKLFGHRQLMSTLSPGDSLFDIIRTWPHFVNDTSDVKELLPQLTS